MLTKNMLCEIQITDLNNLGFGVGRVEGKVVFVSGAVDGDLVEARIIRVNSGYAIARTERVLLESKHRSPSPCAAPGCGGCAYRHITQAHEAELKENYVREVFRKQGMADVTVLPLLTTGERYHYRNKAQYPVAPEKGGGLRIGFYAPKSHRVVAAEDCPLQDATFAPIVKRLHALFDQYKIPAYEEETGDGLVRHIYLRAGKESGELLLALVLNGDRLPHAEEIVSDLRSRFPSLVGILINVNRENTNVICGDAWHTLWGKGTMVDTLCGVELEISPAAFYQVNHDAAELLYRRARELADLHGDELLLDLFCGAGSIGLSMADGVREVIGIEIVESAVACAKQNAARNGIKNASFYCGDAEDTEKLLTAAETARGENVRPDVVILDPPRKGCGEELLAYIARLAPKRIVYISCNPDTLARDCVTLTASGYQMGEVTPVDLFPCTGHVESVVCLTLRRSQKSVLQH
ncbi:MAG: 23S rRNA (uracil(1939)-C(5))-methyltransferase RlmD [Clostridia bacterium]|nr:23S rRNA (uracil(1939)-C(5))-methyltransferase RlmD [Clostridia bacterium]